MKTVIRALLIVVLLAPILLYTPSAYAQDTDCNAELLSDTEAHDVAMYLFSEVERPIFNRQQFVFAVIIYANKLIIEEDVCGLGTQAKLLSWALEVYRIQGSHYLAINDAENPYTEEDEVRYQFLLGLLFNERERLYEMYCEAFPITCIDGTPMSYADLLNSIEPESTNSPL